MKRILLTGGGTAGHVTPNMALIPGLKEAGYDIQYVGSYNGIERRLIEDMGNPLSRNLFRKAPPVFLTLRISQTRSGVLKGYAEASRLIKKAETKYYFFPKGGFCCRSGGAGQPKRRHVPVIIHESDLTPGLANKLCIPSATKVCCNFPETLKHLPGG